MKYLFFVLTVLAAAQLPSGAPAAEPPAPAAAALPPVIPPHEPRPEPEKEWTIMVFMNGNNNLANFVRKDIREMEEDGPPEEVNILVQAGRAASSGPGSGPYPHPDWNDPSFLGRGSFGGGTDFNKNAEEWTGVRRYLIKQNGVFGEYSQLKGILSDVDMGDYRQVAAFGLWAKKNFPARHYMLMIWNHGSGWKNKPVPAGRLRNISHDDGTGSEITVDELGLALRGMGGADIYASDACLMQMAEVVHALKGAAQIAIGSEENEPADGWPYDLFLQKLHGLPVPRTAEAVAAAAVSAYEGAYAVTGKAATLSALRIYGIEELRGLLDDWVGLAMNEDPQVLASARTAADGFAGADSRDLIGFIEAVGALEVSAPLKEAGRRLTAHFQNKMLLANGASGAHLGRAHGLGIYLPLSGYAPNYEQLDWAKRSRWPEFLHWFNAAKGL